MMIGHDMFVICDGIGTTRMIYSNAAATKAVNPRYPNACTAILPPPLSFLAVPVQVLWLPIRSPPAVTRTEAVASEYVVEIRCEVAASVATAATLITHLARVVASYVHDTASAYDTPAL